MSRIRFALRTLVKTPVITTVVVLSLALGIGANTAIFSLMYQILLRSLPVEKPEELVLLTSPGDFKGGRNSTDNSGGMDSIFSYRMFRELEKHPESLTGLAGFRQYSANLAYRNQTVNGNVLLVSGAYFPVLGVKPMVGRMLEPADDRHGAPNPVIVLSYGYWKDRLGGDTSVLNKPLRVNGQLMTIVGVAPSGFTSTVLGTEPSVYVPLAWKPQMTPGWDGTDRWDDYWVYAFGRLKPGATRERAAAGLNSHYAGLVEEQSRVVKEPDARKKQRFLQSRLSLIEGKQGQSYLRTARKVPLIILMCATAMVLLIAMANAANLLLARSAQRGKELAIRTALGASRAEIMGQILTEALVLAVSGGLAGVLLGMWTLDLLTSQLNTNGPSYSINAHLDLPVLAFSLGISLLTGILFGMYPAWSASRTAPSDTLKDQAGSVSTGKGGARVRRLLVCAQVTISAILLLPTGLLLKSLTNLMHVDLGVRTENVITFGLSPELNGYKDDQSRSFFERAEQNLAAIPGVKSAVCALVPLISGSRWGSTITVEGYQGSLDDDRSHSLFNRVSPGFFSKMGIPLLAGREFDERDNMAGTKVAVVNERFAKHFFGDKNPLGKKFVEGWGTVVPDIEIVGVVKDSNYSGVREDDAPKVFYMPWRQGKNIGSMQMYVRTALPPTQMVPQIRRTLAALDNDLPVEDLRTFEEQVRLNIQSDRMGVQLAAAFALLATLLSMLGLYGVMAYSVTRRTREIGIRVALGADSGEIRGMVLREAMVILGAGLAVGIPCALGLARFTESQLFGVKPFDAAVLAAVMVALTMAALAAGVVPAWRATRVNPIEALRYE